MTSSEPIKVTQRLLSLDAYRGVIMICLISHAFGFYALKDHPYFNFLAEQTEHRAWEGCTFWDLIQPAFMFMVGVAMPFSLGKRKALGASQLNIYLHVFRRSIVLVLIAVMFNSIHAGILSIGFVNVLPQIAFGYFFASFLVDRSFRAQGVAAALILLIYTIVWVLFSNDPWTKGNDNIGSVIDMWMLGEYYGGFYVGSNAIPSTATIIFGLMCGKLIASESSPKRVMKLLLIVGLAGLVSGYLLSFLNPMVKRIWTASFTLYSTGWVVLFLLLFYWVVEVKDYRRWTFVLVVVGMNSIAAYIMFQLFRGWINNALLAFTRPVIEPMGTGGVILQALLVLGAQWYVLYFFYKNKIFFKV